MKRLAVWMGVRSFFENSTVCLKIDAKYPVLMGQALHGFRVVWWLFWTVFPLVVRLWPSRFLPEAFWGGQCFTARDQYGPFDALFRASGGFLLRSSCIQWFSFRGGSLIRHQRRV